MPAGQRPPQRHTDEFGLGARSGSRAGREVTPVPTLGTRLLLQVLYSRQNATVGDFAAFMPLWDLHLSCVQRWFMYRTGGHLNPHGRCCALVRPRGESQLFRDGPCTACAPLLCSRLADIADIAEHSCLKPPQQVDGTRRSFAPTSHSDSVSEAPSHHGTAILVATQSPIAKVGTATVTPPRHSGGRDSPAFQARNFRPTRAPCQ